MANTLLVTRPFYDPTTSYLHYWNLNIIDTAKRKSMKVIDLDSKRANKKELTSVIEKVRPSLVLLNGHGNDNMILGQDGEILIKVGENEYILNNCLIYALSCKSAKVLGPSSIKAGAKAYIGYVEDFIFFVENDYSTRPQSDPIAGLFLKPTNIIVESLIKGHAAGKAEENGRREFNKNIQSVLSSKSSEGYLARFLIWDMIHQVCLGDHNSTI